MSEEKKEEKPKTEVQPPAPPATSTGAQPPTPPTPLQAPISQPPKPVTTPTGAPQQQVAVQSSRPPVPIARPPVTTPPSAQPVQKGRRGFIKFLVAVGVLLSLAPYMPWGQFLSASVKGSGTYSRQKIIIDNNSQLYKNAAGKAVNVNDLQTFPANSHWLITYPSSGDSTLDAQNTDTFDKFELIRLPKELGGEKKDASSFAAFSKVCVHLWCSPNYNPTRGHQAYECPCHGSIYRIPDGLSVVGPASVQPPPTDAIPVLTLSTDSQGFLFIQSPLWDIYHNGVLGYGRYILGVNDTDAYKEYLKKEGI